MSNQNINGIRIKNDAVYLTAVDSNAWSSHFEVTWECDSFTEVLREKGETALYAKIGEELWGEELSLVEGNQLCNLFLKARSLFPADMNFTTFDAQIAGVLLGEMVAKLEKDPHVNLSEYINYALMLKNDRDYILDAVKRTGWNYLNYASEEVQKDRAFALEVLHAGGKQAWFQYPTYYSEDKAFALEALKLNGCLYRGIGTTLKADREVILEAFRKSPEKELYEFLPNLIPPEAYCKGIGTHQPSELDKDFIFQLLDQCPAMHLYRAPRLIEDRDVAMKWVQVGTFFPHCLSDLPAEYRNDREFQGALIRRFEHTDKFEYLVQNFAINDIEVSPMKQIHVTLSVDEDTILRESGQDNLDDAISQELNWLHDSGFEVENWSYAALAQEKAQQPVTPFFDPASRAAETNPSIDKKFRLPTPAPPSFKQKSLRKQRTPNLKFSLPELENVVLSAYYIYR